MHRIILFIKHLSPQQMILMYYLVAFIVASIFLSIPVLYREGVNIPLIDVIFMAASALSVTGLSSVTIDETYNTYGYIALMIIMNLGGIGIMAMGTIVYMLFRRKISYRERLQIMVESNQNEVSGAVKLVTEIVSVILLIEIVGAILYAVFFFSEGYSLNIAILNGTFLSVAATTNGGLDVFGDSLISFNNNYFLQIAVMVQIVLGAIGFPVLIEVKRWMSAMRNKEHFRFSLFTKLAFSTYVILFLFGTVAIFAMETRRYFRFDDFFNSLMNSIFSSITSRSGGLVTVDPVEFTDGTQLIMSALMFIGSSPSSAGGGIRTTTFAVLVLFLIAFSRGQKHVHVFQRTIDRTDIDRAIAVIMLAIILVFSGIVSISLIENNRFELVRVIFEVTSAFGTAGASTGITAYLHPVSKIILILFMFIGRIGFVAFLFSISGRHHSENYMYPKERILIG